MGDGGKCGGMVDNVRGMVGNVRGMVGNVRGMVRGWWEM